MQELFSFNAMKVKSSLLMVLYLTREEWKSVLILSGVRSAMIGGKVMTLKLYADSLATGPMVD